MVYVSQSYFVMSPSIDQSGYEAHISITIIIVCRSDDKNGWPNGRFWVKYVSVRNCAFSTDGSSAHLESNAFEQTHSSFCIESFLVFEANLGSRFATNIPYGLGAQFARYANTNIE